jgi:photosystem II PsbT protein
VIEQQSVKQKFKEQKEMESLFETPFIRKKFIKKRKKMEALVYTFLLIGTLLVLFFAVFFRESPRIIRS